MDFWCIVKVERKEFVGGWDVVHERRRSEYGGKALGLRDCKGGLSLNGGGKTMRGTWFI